MIISIDRQVAYFYFYFFYHNKNNINSDNEARNNINIWQNEKSA